MRAGLITAHLLAGSQEAAPSAHAAARGELVLAVTNEHKKFNHSAAVGTETRHATREEIVHTGERTLVMVTMRGCL